MSLNGEEARIKRESDCQSRDGSDNEMQSSKKIWTEELTEQLILFYKEREYLWNRSDKHYRDVNKKRTAQLEIGELLGFTSEEILKRWTNLRNTYGQNLKQEQKFISAGSAKEIRWAHYKSLDFLIPQMLLSGLVDNSNQSSDPLNFAGTSNSPTPSMPSPSPSPPPFVRIPAEKRKLENSSGSPVTKRSFCNNNKYLSHLEEVDEFDEGVAVMATDLRLIERISPGEGRKTLIGLKLFLSDSLRTVSSKMFDE